MMTTIDYWRQLGILPPGTLIDREVTVIGVGGIGSPVALILAKMGLPRITVFDDDMVDTHNLPNQLYRLEDVGRAKVLALKDIIATYTPDVEVEAIPERVGHEQKLGGIVICAVDSMEARREVWEAVRFNIRVPLFIEARMGAEVLRIHTLTPFEPDLIRWYETTLHSDTEAVEAPCTERAIMYTVMIMGGLIANQVKKHLRQEATQREIIFDLINLMLMVQ